MGELITRGKHYKVQRDDRVVDGDEVQARGDGDDGHGAPAWRRGEAAPGGGGAPEEGGDPWGLRPLDPSSSLVMVLVWMSSFPSLAAAKREEFHGFSWGPPKIGFPSIYSGGDAI